MSDAANPTPGKATRPVPRRSVLDLAPLELDCMNTLWPLGEATVRDIREHLAQRRPRAYTTIMTIMDRLACKGIVERSKRGRAYVYRARLSLKEARTQAVGQLVNSFFAGSPEALLEQLQASTAAPAEQALRAGASTGGEQIASSVRGSESIPSQEPPPRATGGTTPASADDDRLDPASPLAPERGY
jgi:predicted transcriptional regulator